MGSTPYLRSLWALLLVPVVYGKLMKSEMNVTWEVGAPNGQSREMILMNGQFPGPSLIFDEDDDVEVFIDADYWFWLPLIKSQITVYNNMPFNTTVHWHGLMYVIKLSSN